MFYKCLLTQISIQSTKALDNENQTYAQERQQILADKATTSLGIPQNGVTQFAISQ